MVDTVEDTSAPLRFDSAGMPPEEGFWLWRDQMSPIFDVAVPDAAAVEGFHGCLETHHMGSVLLGRCTTVTQSFERSERVIARSGIDHYLVQLQRQGSSRGVMGRREVDVGPGDVCILDLAQTVHTVDRDMDTLTLCLPREMLAPLVAAPDSLHGLVMRGDSALGAMLAEHIRSLYGVAGALSAREALTVARGSAAFVAGCLGPTIDALDLVRPQMRASRMAAIKRHIDRHLGDPDFSAAHLAEAFGISRPTLYRLFEPMDGVAAYILRRRLDRSLADLMSSHGQPRIAEIARRWGFRSETAFSRAFRTAFGQPPRDVRSSAQHRRPPAAGTPDAFKRWFHELAIL